MKFCVSHLSACLRVLLHRRAAAFGLVWGLLTTSPLESAWAGAYELGLRMYEQGNYEMAVRHFRQAAWENAGNPNAHYYLADSYLKLNRLADAQAEYQKILALAPDSQAARLSRIGLVRLRGYLENQEGDRWRKTGGTGRGEAPDQYLGPPAQGEDYLEEVTENGKNVRWSLSKMPLKIWVERSPQGIRNFQPAFISQISRALDTWAAALNHQLSYVLVSEREKADIRVTWTNTIDTQGHSSDGGTAYTAGLTLPRFRNDQIEYMDVKLATFDIQGKPQTQDVIYPVAVHEFGHALGLLGHSQNPSDIMFAQNQHVTAPSKRDLNTIRRLYTQVADINNLPASARQVDPDREAKLASEMDKSIAKMEAQAQTDGMALTYLNLGVAYFQKAQQVKRTNPEAAGPWLQKALAALGQTLQKEPRDSRALHKRSLVYQELGDYNQALADIRKAISFDRQEPEYYMLQSWYLAKLGKSAEARASLDTYLLYKPGEANSQDVQEIRKALAGSNP